MTDYTQSVNTHYSSGGLAEAILAGLQAAGKDLDALTPDDLALVDQFHTGGKPATLDLLRLAEISCDSEVLDVGGGIGGPARTLATEAGCRVTVLDLTQEFCHVGEMLTERTGLSGRVSFRNGTGLDMPFPNERFDIVWMQNSAMNIADRERLVDEISRVLRPGGRLAFQELMAGALQPVHFPVPWAKEPSISFLRRPDEVRALLKQVGFKEIAWNDATDDALAGARAQVEAMARPGGLPWNLQSVLFGDSVATIVQNQLRNFEEGRLLDVHAVLERP